MSADKKEEGSLLTAREKKVLKLVMQAQTNKKIAATLGISLSTVKRRVLLSVFGAAVVGIGGLPGCAPLPGGSLDPVYLNLGTTPAPASPQIAARPTKPGLFRTSKTAGTSVWVGRYQDNRGEGGIMFALVRREAMLSGIWKLRTGGGGPFNATVDAGGRKLTFRMENTAPECLGTFEGWAEFGETSMVGAYHGKDCEGAVSDGRFDLRPR